MSEAKVIEKISISVQISGNPYFVVMSHDKMMLLINLATSLSDGSLKVKKAPEGFKFTTLPLNKDED